MKHKPKTNEGKLEALRYGRSNIIKTGNIKQKTLCLDWESCIHTHTHTHPVTQSGNFLRLGERNVCEFDISFCFKEEIKWHEFDNTDILVGYSDI